MIVKYRIIQSKWNEQDEWETWGIFYENHGPILKEYPILYAMMLSDPKEIKRHFDHNIRAGQLSLEEAEKALGDYAHRYRLLPDIHEAEGDSFFEIVDDLEEKYLGRKKHERARRMLAALVAADQRRPVKHIDIEEAQRRFREIVEEAISQGVKFIVKDGEEDKVAIVGLAEREDRSLKTTESLAVVAETGQECRAEKKSE